MKATSFIYFDLIFLMFFKFRRCILGYFLEVDEQDLPYSNVPMHTVIKLEPRAYGCHVIQENFDVKCVDTHRPKPEKPGDLEDR